MTSSRSFRQRPLDIACIGGGPAGLYFAILLKKADPRHKITIYERNRLQDTFGFGVVFSDATLGNLERADPESYERICDRFFHWDDIEINFRDRCLTSTGHGFAGLSRVALLEILSERCQELGVQLNFESEVSDLDHLRSEVDLLLAADGANSTARRQFEDRFRPNIDWRPNKFVWLGTSRPFPAFTFYFKANEHGLWRIHAYQYEEGSSTFIVETTAETFEASGLADDDEVATVAFCEELFAEELAGHGLLANRSIWRSFPTVKNEEWSFENVVLLGDSAHTAHFSIGSGTKLAMEDSIALVAALTGEVPGVAVETRLADEDPVGLDAARIATEQTAAGAPIAIDTALAAYEGERRSTVESLQRAAQASLKWFEDTERYLGTEPIQFGFNLLTRSLRITHHDLQLRDADYVETIDRWFADQAAVQSGVPVAEMALLPWRENPRITRPPSPRSLPVEGRVPPPMFTPCTLRGLTIPNRVVVSAMCQYSAEDGVPDDWHFVHLGSRAVGGAGLIMTEMTDVSAEGRITHGCAGIYRPEHVAAWKRIVDFVHDNSASKLGLQLAHAGRKGSTRLAWDGIDQPLDDDGWGLLAASPIPWAEGNPVPKAMDRADMDRVRDDFVRSAQWAAEAGFDLLEIHCAHGYLLATFISPLTNQRTDEYGGSLVNRMRFPLEILDAVRAVWPEDRPISTRISAVDWAPGGMESADAVEVARLLVGHGCDVIDVSAGQTVAYAKPIYGRQFQTPFADRIRHEVGMPTMAVGNISSYMDVNTILAAGRADLCCLARAHLWDPYWIRNAAQKQDWPLPWPDPYSVLDRYTPRFE